MLKWITGGDIHMTHGLDSIAARGMGLRQGVGKVKHLEIKCLWIQDYLRGRNGREKIDIIKVPTSSIVADIGTKALSYDRIRTLMKLGGYVEVPATILLRKHEKASMQAECLTKASEVFEIADDSSEQNEQIVGSIAAIAARPGRHAIRRQQRQGGAEKRRVVSALQGALSLMLSGCAGDDTAETGMVLTVTLLTMMVASIIWWCQQEVYPDLHEPIAMGIPIPMAALLAAPAAGDAAKAKAKANM